MKRVFTFLFCIFSVVGFAQGKTSSSASQTIQIRLQKIAVVDATPVKSSVNHTKFSTTSVRSSEKWLTVSKNISDIEQPILASFSLTPYDETSILIPSETMVYTLTPQ